MANFAVLARKERLCQFMLEFVGEQTDCFCSWAWLHPGKFWSVRQCSGPTDSERAKAVNCGDMECLSMEHHLLPNEL
jgi:hypothetical protein